MNMIKYPKLLPWIAHKAKIPDRRAEALWREAVCDIILRKSSVENHDYPAIFERLHELIEHEKAAAFSGQPVAPLDVVARFWGNRTSN